MLIQLDRASLDRASGERAAFLDHACAADAELRREVKSLVAQDASRTNSVDRPVWEAAVKASMPGPTVMVFGTGSEIGAYRIDASRRRRHG